MVTLDTTTRWVVMLLVAGGVGMIGGIGAALIEGKDKVAAEPPDTKHWRLNTLACIVLGGIAAVAVLYFFVPVKEVLPTNPEEKPVAYYELIKLVPLSLIVGSAGTYFLKSFQQRIDSALAAQQGDQAVAKSKTVIGAAKTLSDQTDKTLDATKANFRVMLQDEVGLKRKTADELAGKLVDEAKKATTVAIQPQVDAIERLAAGLPVQGDEPQAG